MAFFGLTALGPQNTFAAASKKARILHVFEDDDFLNAWYRVNGRDALHGKLSKIGDILRIVFCGPIPPNDEGPIREAFENETFETSETISLTSFMKIMIRLRDEADMQEKGLTNDDKLTDFSSVSQYLETLQKGGKINSIQTKQSMPLTSNQEFGWEKPAKLQPPDHYRRGSEVTKFAAELIKNGVY